MGGLFVAAGCVCILLGAAVWYKVYRDDSYEPIPVGTGSLPGGRRDGEGVFLDLAVANLCWPVA